MTPGNPLDGLKLGKLFSIPYVLTSPFNAPRNYSAFGGKVNDKHEGVDFDVTEPGDSKASALCVYDGRVVKVTQSNGYGKYGIVEHKCNGSFFYTWYCHLDNVYVSEGMTILKGKAVGEIGKTGNVTGEHIHFNLQVPNYGLSGYIVADVVNPLPYF